jgi:hypothetical protein
VVAVQDLLLHSGVHDLLLPVHSCPEHDCCSKHDRSGLYRANHHLLLFAARLQHLLPSIPILLSALPAKEFLLLRSLGIDVLVLLEDGNRNEAAFATLRRPPFFPAVHQDGSFTGKDFCCGQPEAVELDGR